VPEAVEALKSGAVDYVLKPFDAREVLSKIAGYLAQAEPISWTASGSTVLTEELWGGKSPAMQRLYKLIERVAPTDATTLLLGESGTGKEKIAGLLHRLSLRSRGPFVVVDCGSTPSTLLESELFGHTKGSFTNAVKDKKGLIAEAHGGTLFLDEIGNISQEMQLRMLRFLQEKKVRRIGEVHEKSVDCRVIAATNADLAALVRKGQFREDLYYRLKVIAVQVPPLRERTEDLFILADGFLKLFSGTRPAPRLDEDVITAMREYSWPGNVRELRNILEAACILRTDSVIRLHDMQFEAADQEETARGGRLSLENSERQVLEAALEKSGWIIKNAADMLGISRRTMHYKIKKFRLDASKQKS
jgi:DNA-binding NtrC family response regulator